MMFLLVESLILLITLATISPWCAMKIHQNLKKNSLSEQTKKLHRQMLKLLLIQVSVRQFAMDAIINYLFSDCMPCCVYARTTRNYVHISSHWSHEPASNDIHHRSTYRFLPSFCSNNYNAVCERVP